LATLPSYALGLEDLGWLGVVTYLFSVRFLLGNWQGV